MEGIQLTGELVHINPLWVPLAMVFLGVTAAYFGGRLVVLVLAVSGLALGLVYGGGIASTFTSDPSLIGLAPWVFGVLFALLSGFLVKAAFFLAGALLAVAAVFSLVSPPSLIAALIAAVAGGALVCAGRPLVFALLTAAFGSLLTASGTVNLVANFSLFVGVPGFYLIALAVFVSGLIVQLRAVKGTGPAKRRKRR